MSDKHLPVGVPAPVISKIIIFLEITIMSILSDYITEAQLAEELCCNVETIRRWRRGGKGPPHTMLGKRVLFRRAAVVEWLLAQEGIRTRRSLPWTTTSQRR